MPIGSIKEKQRHWTEFNLLLETVSDKIRYLFIDIEFESENADNKQLMYNEIHPPGFDKQKKLNANEIDISTL